MSNRNAQKLEAWFKNFEHRMDTQVPEIIGDTAAEYFKERLIQKNWDNVAWPAYGAGRRARGKAVKEPRRGYLMMRSNNLFHSIRPSQVAPGRVRISAGSAKVPYARVHNEGLRVTGIGAVRQHTKKNFMGKGKPRQIKGHTRKMDFQMPRRRFMGHSAILNREIIKRLRNMRSEI